MWQTLSDTVLESGMAAGRGVQDMVKHDTINHSINILLENHIFSNIKHT